MKEHVNLKELQWNDTLVKFGGHQITALTRVHDLWDLFVNSLCTAYGSGHEGVAVLLPGFAIKW